jgi:hypothetical protein
MADLLDLIVGSLELAIRLTAQSSANAADVAPSAGFDNCGKTKISF